MPKKLRFNVRFSDIGLFTVEVITYRTDIKKAIGDYIRRMNGICVEVLETSDARWV